MSKIRETDFRVVESHAALKRYMYDAIAGGLPPLYLGQHRGRLFTLYLSTQPENLASEYRQLPPFVSGMNKFAPVLYIWVRLRRCKDMIRDPQVDQVLERTYGYCTSLPIARESAAESEVVHRVGLFQSDSGPTSCDIVAVDSVPTDGTKLPGQLCALSSRRRGSQQLLQRRGAAFGHPRCSPAGCGQKARALRRPNGDSINVPAVLHFSVSTIVVLTIVGPY